MTATDPARDAAASAAISYAHRQPTLVQQAVDDARADGVGWTAIGLALGITGTGARSTYGRVRDRRTHVGLPGLSVGEAAVVLGVTDQTVRLRITRLASPAGVVTTAPYGARTVLRVLDAEALR